MTVGGFRFHAQSTVTNKEVEFATASAESACTGDEYILSSSSTALPKVPRICSICWN
jgi:hypothetical protein